MPERPLPTRKVCDLVDDVRRNTSILLSLHNIIKKKEKELSNLILSSSTTINFTSTAKTTKSKGKMIIIFINYYY